MSPGAPQASVVMRSSMRYEDASPLHRQVKCFSWFLELRSAMFDALRGKNAVPDMYECWTIECGTGEESSAAGL
ncbi:MAG: hypothetical protein KJO38_02460 [Gammaproteobacteria bacterium]|nr:hypothetical protein [Gammaproteobacteria bacterium]